MKHRAPLLLLLGMGTTLVEVERKFLAPSGLAEKVAGLGGRCLGVKEFTDRYWDDGHWRLCSQEHRESFIEVQPHALKESSKADVQVGSLAPKTDPMYLCDRHRLGTSTYIECRHAWLLCHR
eukprot:s3803_g1.t1